MATQRRTYTLFLPALALLLMLALPAQAQRLAVKTNVLYLAAGAPDLGFELVTGEHVSVSLSAFGTYNPYWRDKSLGEGTQTALFAFRPEIRYWFNGRPMTRFFTGVNLLAGVYDFPLSQAVRKGSMAGAGICAGYVINLTKRLDLEVSSGAGLLFYWGKRADGREDPIPAQDLMPADWGYKLMPTQLGVTLVYIIK